MKENFPSQSSTSFHRERALKALEKDNWDLVVIGGGASGLGIALEATTRGYKTLLVEQVDFAKGTSSKSTKLVHGGVRYLANGEFKLVREASIERGVLTKNAAHLVSNQEFIIPIYSIWDKIKYGIGLKCYDWIAGKWSLGASHFVSKSATIKAMSAIKTNGLIGGILYHDGQFDDARLALNLAQTIWEQGGMAVNYMLVTGLITSSSQQLTGLYLKDQETGKDYEVFSKAIVNATGVFVDNILKMDNHLGHPLLRVSQGVHLVIDKKFFPSANALMIPKTNDGRVLFIVPWHGKLILGTTDTPVNKASLEPVAIESEIDFILQTASDYLEQKPNRSDVLSVFAGLRPLAAPQKAGGKTKEISRSHKILVSPSGLFTMVGGKWTTYRKMGEDMIDQIEQKKGWHHTKSKTQDLLIHGASTQISRDDPFYYYGSDAAIIHQTMDRFENGWISLSLNIHEAQVVFAVQHEMARTLEDILARRTRALLLDAKEAVKIAKKVAQIMAKELERNPEWVEQQVQNFENLAKQYVLD